MLLVAEMAYHIVFVDLVSRQLSRIKLGIGGTYSVRPTKRVSFANNDVFLFQIYTYRL